MSIRYLHSLKRGIIFLVIFLILFVIESNHKVVASNVTYNLEPTRYESEKSFDMSTQKIKDSFVYGEIGKLSITGNIKEEAIYNDVTAYKADEPLTVGYLYKEGSYNSKKDKWHLINNKLKAVLGISLPEKLKSGCMIIQKSTDGKNWTNADEPICDFFDDDNEKKELYVISDNDIKNGMYYRVIVAYEMETKIGTEGRKFLKDKEVYQSKYFVEQYKFYAGYAGNPITIKDVNSRRKVDNNKSVDNGFYIDNNNANVRITVSKDKGKEITVKAFDAFYDSGKYTVKTVLPTGENYKTIIKIKDGLRLYNPVESVRFQNEDKDNYAINQSTKRGIELTTLSIGYDKNSSLKSVNINGYNAFGTTGNTIKLFLDLKNKKEVSKSEWKVVDDDWGKKEKQTIDNVWPNGEIKSGALIVRKSYDGKKWEKVATSDGLITTDYYNNYNGKGNVMIYSPSGKDFLKGIYIKVYYAYEIQKKDGKEKKRCLEIYNLYLCSDELDAVTFHNKSVEDEITNSYKDGDKTILEVYKSAESMKDGSVTTTGFSIDTSNNPTVKYEVLHDGVSVPNAKEFTEDGKYEITLTSAVNSTKKVTLYIDTRSPEETLKTYFGAGFIVGKRIWDDGKKYPVYEALESKYNYETITTDLQPLYGTIKNLSTSKEWNVIASRNGRTTPIETPGEYEVVLNNNPTYKSEEPSGDNKKIVFHYTIIPNGTAPGPQVNEKNLKDSINMGVFGLYPKYYALRYSTAASKKISLAFSSRQDALNYAYNYEKGIATKCDDGTYLYSPSYSPNEPELRYKTEWDLTEAINSAADEAIVEGYFDISDEATFITLENRVLEKNKNPLSLELSRSVVIIADGQEDLLTNLTSDPILNAQPFAYITPGINGTVKQGESHFEFIKDSEGIDSSLVRIIDSKGAVHNVNYNENVAEILQRDNCPTGKVTIHEENIYGDSSEYSAVYFANGENTSRITLNIYKDGEENTTDFSQQDDGIEISAEAFSIKEITDELDPYELVLIQKDQQSTYSYVADQNMNGIWAEPGRYTVKVINRAGCKYEIAVNIDKAIYSTVSFTGEGTEDFESIVLNYGDTDVELPIPSKEGYEFEEYIDSNGNSYSDKIAKVSFKGSIVLSPKFKAIAKAEELNYFDDSKEESSNNKSNNNSPLAAVLLLVFAGGAVWGLVKYQKRHSTKAGAKENVDTESFGNISDNCQDCPSDEDDKDE